MEQYCSVQIHSAVIAAKVASTKYWLEWGEYLTWNHLFLHYIFLMNWHYSVEICFHFGIKYIFCAFFVFYIPSNTRENIWGVNTFYRPCWWNKTVSLTVWHVFFLFMFFQCYVQTVFWKTDFLSVFFFFSIWIRVLWWSTGRGGT